MLVLPRVDRDGDSDCPFAEQLYGKKEEAEQRLAEHLEVFDRQVAGLNVAILQCETDLDTVLRDAAELLQKYKQNHTSSSFVLFKFNLVIC